MADSHYVDASIWRHVGRSHCWFVGSSAPPRVGVSTCRSSSCWRQGDIPTTHHVGVSTRRRIEPSTRRVFDASARRVNHRRTVYPQIFMHCVNCGWAATIGYDGQQGGKGRGEEGRRQVAVEGRGHDAQPPGDLGHGDLWIPQQGLGSGDILGAGAGGRPPVRRRARAACRPARGRSRITPRSKQGGSGPVCREQTGHILLLAPATTAR